MRQAISFFFGVVALMVVLRIFAPGLADELVTAIGKVLAIVNASLDLLLEQSNTGTTSF